MSGETETLCLAGKQWSSGAVWCCNLPKGHGGEHDDGLGTRWTGDDRATNAGPINYVVGDATAPIGDGSKIIAHVCNDQGSWGAGFVLALSNRWDEPELQYRLWWRHRADFPFDLGKVQLVTVQSELWVANMIAQHGVANSSVRFCGTYAEVPPIRYEAVETCLSKVAMKAGELQASVHMPRIGCGLAGGQWENIEPIIKRTLCASGVSTYVYDLP